MILTSLVVWIRYLASASAFLGVFAGDASGLHPSDALLYLRPCTALFAENLPCLLNNVCHSAFSIFDTS